MQHGYWQQRRGSADIRYVSNISSENVKRSTFFHCDSPGGTNYRCYHPLVVSRIGEHSPRQKKSRIESDSSHLYNSL